MPFSISKVPFLKKNVRRVTANLNFPSIATDANSVLTVTVPGAKTGDAVTVHPLTTPPAGLTYIGWVSAADTVSVRAQNSTAAAIDAAATDFLVQALSLV